MLHSIYYCDKIRLQFKTGDNIMQKEITEDIVQIATLLLIKASPSNNTTTLEVKKLLRYLDFYATQNYVSTYMDNLYNQELLSFEVYYPGEGKDYFRLYTEFKEEVVSEEDELDTFCFTMYPDQD